MFSPSRSQSVHMNRIWAPRACDSMLPAMILVLPCVECQSISRSGWIRSFTCLSNETLYGSLKEICGWAGLPLPVSLGEVLRYNMTRSACERYVALPPLLEAKVELIVLDPLDTANAVLCQVSSSISPLSQEHPQRTVVTLPPRWLATAFAIEGFSATQSTLILLACWDEHRVHSRAMVTRQKSYKLARESASNREGASRWS